MLDGGNIMEPVLYKNGLPPLGLPILSDIDWRQTNIFALVIKVASHIKNAHLLTHVTRASI